MTPRSWLIVPADQDDRVQDALSSDADALIFDLEDTVLIDRKAHARDLLREHLAAAPTLPRRPAQQRWVRINRADTEHYGADLSCCEDLHLDGLVLPKVEHGDDVRRLAADTAESGWLLHAIVGASPASLFHLATFQDSGPALAAMSWGIDDLAVALGATSKFDAQGNVSPTLKLARSLCLAAARAAGAQPVDAVNRDVTDEPRLAREAVAARLEGFSGKLAVHSSQVAVINEGFTPTSEELDAAQAVVDAFDAQPTRGALRRGPREIDRTRLAQAQALLSRRPAAH